LVVDSGSLIEKYLAVIEDIYIFDVTTDGRLIERKQLLKIPDEDKMDDVEYYLFKEDLRVERVTLENRKNELEDQLRAAIKFVKFDNVKNYVEVPGTIYGTREESRKNENVLKEKFSVIENNMLFLRDNGEVIDGKTLADLYYDDRYKIVKEFESALDFLKDNFDPKQIDSLQKLRYKGKNGERQLAFTTETKMKGVGTFLSFWNKSMLNESYWLVFGGGVKPNDSVYFDRIHYKIYAIFVNDYLIDLMRGSSRLINSITKLASSYSSYVHTSSNTMDI
jgi:hypothetical protein